MELNIVARTPTAAVLLPSASKNKHEQFLDRHRRKKQHPSKKGTRTNDIQQRSTKPIARRTSVPSIKVKDPNKNAINESATSETVTSLASVVKPILLNGAATSTSFVVRDTIDKVAAPKRPSDSTSKSILLRVGKAAQESTVSNNAGENSSLKIGNSVVRKIADRPSLRLVEKSSRQSGTISDIKVTVPAIPVEAVSSSRKRPSRTSDEAYAKHHMSVAALSQASMSSPLESQASQHIFAQSSFSELGLHSHLCSLLQRSRASGGFELDRPTRVQQLAIEPMMAGKSVFIKSQTGSGKTLAFLLPIIHRLQSASTKPTRADGTYCIILAPTRELCTQIHDVVAKMVQPFIWLIPGCVSGGERKKSEKSRLRKGIHILVATPGRLLDHLRSTESFRHSKLQILVLDEVDRLMDMGFEVQVKEILKLLSVKPEGGLANYGIGSYRKVQTALASATFTASIEALLKEHLGPHDFVDADGGVNATNSTPSRQLSHSFDIPEQLVQHSVSVTYKLKLAALTATLRNSWKSGEKVVMFLSTTAEVDFLDNLFRLTAWPDSTVSSKGSLFEQWPIYRLHGKVEQKDRAATFAAFHPLKSGLLICTDVAARGLDLPKVDFIIQYDPPTEVSDYVHRIGRTARRGCPGTSLLFLSPNESSFLDVLSSHGLKLIPLSLQATLDRGFSDSSKAKAQVTPLSLHEHLEKAVAKSATLHDMALCAYQAFVRAYSAHSGELKNVFQVRLLHLGHVARSFALQEAPRAIKDHVPKKSDKGKKRSIAEHLTSTSKQGSGNASKKMRPNGSSMTAADTI